MSECGKREEALVEASGSFERESDGMEWDPLKFLKCSLLPCEMRLGDKS